MDEKIARYHAIERTSPKGTPFRGTCWQCGKADLTTADAAEPCENISGLTNGESLIMAVQGEPRANRRCAEN